MRKIGWTIAGAAVMAAGIGLFASNLASKISLPLEGPGGSSVSGTQSICFPYKLGPTMADAAAVRDDVNAQAGQDIFVSLARLDPATDLPQLYTGDPADNFPLAAGEGYLLTVSQTFNYAIIGADDPGLVLRLKGTDEGANSGNFDFCPPYNASVTTAGELKEDIEAFAGQGSVLSILRWAPEQDVFVQYSGTSASNFSIERGRAYRIQVSRSVDYVPSRR